MSSPLPRETADDESITPLPEPGTFSGTRAVLAMFGMGLLMSLAMLGYWYINLSEFFPLQKALAKDFEKCTPRVDAGKRKDEPMLLRVILQIPETPRAGTPRTDRMISRSLELIREHVKLDRFDRVQIFLVYREPEKQPFSLRYEFEVPDLQKGKTQPKIVENP